MSLSRNLLANYGATAWSTAVNFVTVPIYIKYLGIESYGLIGFMLTFHAWLLLFDLGIASTLNRRMAQRITTSVEIHAMRNYLHTIEIVYALLAISLVLVIILSSTIATHWLTAVNLTIDTLERSVKLMGLVLLAQWMGILYRNALLGLQKHQNWLSSTAALFVTGRAVLTISAFFFWKSNILVLLLVYAVVNAVETLILRNHLQKNLPESLNPIKFNLNAVMPTWRFSANLAVMGLLSVVLTQVDKILLVKFLTLENFGYFSLAFTAASFVLVAVMPINNVAYPIMSSLVAHNDQITLKIKYHYFSQLASIAVLPAAVVIALFAENIVYVWTGNLKIASEVAPILTIWVIGTAINGLILVPYSAQLAHGQAKLFVRLNLIAVLIALPLFIFIVPQFGAIAAAWIWLGTNVTYFTVGIIFMHVKIMPHEKWRWYWQDVAFPLLTGLIVGLLFLEFLAMPKSRLQQFILLFFIFTGTAFAVGCAVPIGRQTLRRLFNSLRKTAGWI